MQLFIGTDIQLIQLVRNWLIVFSIQTGSYLEKLDTIDNKPSVKCWPLKIWELQSTNEFLLLKVQLWDMTGIHLQVLSIGTYRDILHIFTYEHLLN